MQNLNTKAFKQSGTDTHDTDLRPSWVWLHSGAPSQSMGFFWQDLEGEARVPCDGPRDSQWGQDRRAFPFNLLLLSRFSKR